MPDRLTPPVAAAFQHRPLPACTERKLANGIPVYMLQYGSVDVMEVQLVFRAGTNYQPGSGVASFTAQNMAEATKNFSSFELAKKLDGYGAWIDTQAEEEGLTLNLATLSTRLPETLPLLADIMLNPSLSVHEFDRLKLQGLQKKTVEGQQKRTQARRQFSRLIYGETHPYGTYFGVPELEKISREDIRTYFEEKLQSGNLTIILAGKFDETAVWNLLEAHFGQIPTVPCAPQAYIQPPPVAASGRHFFEQEGMQSSLRLGHLGMMRSHPDFYKMQVVNTILGGYFGSRLMRNIREEKGYTYGIYSGWIGQRYNGYLVIQGDVGNEYVDATVEEVKKEMRKLIEKGIGEEELQLVKNYMLGHSIGQRETPFQLGDILRFSVMNDISFEEIDRKFSVINALQVGEVSDLAATYLQPNQLLEVVVGGK